MTQREHLIRKCTLCDTVVEVLNQCGPEIICCGRRMSIVAHRSTAPQRDQHILLMEPHGATTVVRVGAPEHPVTKSHHIAWIEVLAGGRCLRQYLAPGEEAKAVFEIAAQQITAGRCYCNLHGLWRFTPQAMRQVDEFAQAG